MDLVFKSWSQPVVYVFFGRPNSDQVLVRSSRPAGLGSPGIIHDVVAGWYLGGVPPGELSPRRPARVLLAYNLPVERIH